MTIDAGDFILLRRLKHGCWLECNKTFSLRGFLDYNPSPLWKTKEHKLVRPKLLKNQEADMLKSFKILLALSGLKHALTNNPGYNNRVAECEEAARVLLQYDS
ncbi:Galacturonokinase [Vitis vinifera]|uniref:Galacturonokinase n=1 Tax=Vitis vinifera TaxID=29760 RepID=A0A438HNJ1_VITVI|nr:Galacturonokinase [Vitis vinifera]